MSRGHFYAISYRHSGPIVSFEIQTPKLEELRWSCHRDRYQMLKGEPEFERFCTTVQKPVAGLDELSFGEQHSFFFGPPDRGVEIVYDLSGLTISVSGQKWLLIPGDYEFYFAVVEDILRSFTYFF